MEAFLIIGEISYIFQKLVIYFASIPVLAFAYLPTYLQKFLLGTSSTDHHQEPTFGN